MADYKAIAAGLRFPEKILIDGELKDAAKAHKYARKLKAGTVGVNAYSEGEISTPFGGFKASGFGGRDNGIHSHDQYTELKTIWIDLNG